ncbi:MAG TPA: hypothetical protein VHK65_13935 [Candidatus Dormibacteraeota bacterium]|nr:hypothetical protein [Candidatus Dormibacteraeota bacterium]
MARAIGHIDRARSLQLDQAASYEAEALERVAEGGLIELALLSDASSLYARAGAGADVQRLKSALAAASQRAEEGLHVVESTSSIPQSAIENAADEMINRLGNGKRSKCARCTQYGLATGRPQ